MKKIKLFSALIISSLFFVACDRDELIEIKKGQGGGLFELSENGKVYKTADGDESYRVDTVNFLSLDLVKEVIRKRQDDETGFYQLNFNFNPVGTTKFKEMTERNLDKKIIMIVKDKVIMSPVVRTIIADGKVSVTLTSQDELEELISNLIY